MKLGLLGRPRLLVALLAIEALLILPTAWLLRIILGRGMDFLPRVDRLLVPNGIAWAELLFVDRLHVSLVLVSISVGATAWFLIGAAMPAAFVSSLCDQDRGVRVAERTVRHAPALWRIALKGFGILACALLSVLPFIGLLFLQAKAAPSYEAYLRIALVVLAIGLPTSAVISAIVDAARLFHLEGAKQPFAKARALVRAYPLRLIALSLGYGLLWLVFVGGFLFGIPLVVGSLGRVVFWRTLFVTTRLVLRSARLLAIRQTIFIVSK